MLEVHDWPETIIGDEVIVTYDKKEKEKLKDSKFQRELEAMLKIIFSAKSNLDAEVLRLWTYFEKRQDEKSLFARQIDKYQSIEKAWEYQQKGENVLVQDFIDYYREDITHKILKEKMLKIENLAKSIRT
jgi:5'-deoxynucleotidase YfbR-like HD superfamily hydrolase